MSTAKRNVSLDVAKGIGIILVVMGHAMSPVMAGDRVMEAAYRVLYVFHMPLFFMLSGLVASKLIGGGTLSRRERIKRRATRLMIPYFVWAGIYSPMKRLLKEQVRFQQEYAWWTIEKERLIPGSPIFEGMMGATTLTHIMIMLHHFRFSSLTNRIVTAERRNSTYRNHNCPSGLFPIRMYQLGFFFIGMILIPKMDTAFGNAKLATLCLFLWGGYSVLLLCSMDVWPLKALSAFCACYCVLFFGTKISGTRIADRLAFLGRNSMDIYILHAPILVIGRMVFRRFLPGTLWLYAAALTVIALTSALLISRYIVRKVKLFRLLLLGIE